MPRIQTLKPRKPIPYVEIDTSDLNSTIKSRKRLEEILGRNVDVWRDSNGEASLQFRWNHKAVEVQHMSLVIRLSEFELCIVEPEDPPIGNILVDLSHPLVRSSREHIIGGIG